MCGICGSVSFGSAQPPDRAGLERMGRTLYHRGPDDEGYYLDGTAALGMRRLSIIDLETGRQPVTNEDGTVWLVFNGEIYNYRELRSSLRQKGHRFSSQSDSEVIVHAYEEYGDRCVDRFNGMFAFAIWDSTRRRLMLARDRIGIKPLYYWASRDQLVFGSELKAVMAHPGVPKQLDPIAIDSFLTLEYVPSPRTILEGVSKLAPGHLLTLEEGNLRVEQYWDLTFQETPTDEASCVERLTDLLQDAVRMQLVSDVPLGAFLSGGIDSSTVVAFMSAAVTEPVQTFSIGFEDDSYNELPYARAVSVHFGTDHHEEVLQPDITDLAAQLAGHLDEPVGDFSILPTYLVSRLARRTVKVVLSGDGGDELFGGYDTYVAQGLDRFYSRLPAAVRQGALPVLMSAVPPQSAKKGLINKAKRFVEGAALPASLQHARWMVFLDERDKAALYRPGIWPEQENGNAFDIIGSHFCRAPFADPLAQQQYVDIKTYLADNILTKVDRMSMAASVEARVPLLDHRIVEFAASLPAHMKMRGSQTKVILRKAMAERLPAAVLSKAKQGFSIPVKNWLRGPLRPMMADLLSAETVNRRGYFESSRVSQWVSEHLNGRANHSHKLWALMVLELWQQQLLDRKAN